LRGWWTIRSVGLADLVPDDCSVELPADDSVPDDSPRTCSAVPPATIGSGRFGSGLFADLVRRLFGWLPADDTRFGRLLAAPAGGRFASGRFG